MRIVVAGCLAQKDRGDDPAHARPGSTSWSARTRCPGCSTCCTAPRPTARRWTSASTPRSSRAPCPRPRGRAPRLGLGARWDATTPARSASCRSSAVRSARGPIGDVLAEVQGLARRGVVEVTLLGQNVNTYGRDLTVPGSARRRCSRELLRAVNEVDGHPADPVHEPAPARLHRTTCRGDGRERRGVRAHPLPAAVGFGPRAARRCSARTVASATSAWLERIRDGDPGHRGDAPTSSSGSPARPRRTSRTRSTSFERARFDAGVHVPVLAPARDARRGDGRPGRQAGGPGAVRPAGRAPGGDRARAEARAGRLVGRGADRGARAQGRRARPDAGQPLVHVGGRARAGTFLDVAIVGAHPHHLDGELAGQREPAAVG